MTAIEKGKNGTQFASVYCMMAFSHSIPSTDAAPMKRLNLLLTCGSWRQDSPILQLPRLLDPFGIRSLTAKNGEEAVQMIEKRDIHIAIVDLAIPLQESSVDRRPGGERVLQLLRRLDPRPPTIVRRPKQTSTREKARSLARSLQEGAFTVVDRPARLETLLDALRRVLRRYYRNEWPS